MQDLRFRSTYAHTGDGRRALGSLIRDTFGIEISSLDRLGHDPSVLAFGWWSGEHLVANVSVYERQLWLCGRRVKAFGVQSVATRPDWRNRGLFRDLFGRALAYADQRADLIVLSTGTPDLYRRFGFRQIEEVRFGSETPAGTLSEDCRELSLERDDDLSLIAQAFAHREPTSLLASACDHPALFMLKAKLTPEIKLFHLEKLNAVVAIKQNEFSLTILDIVAARMPSVAQIVGALGFTGLRTEVHLTPERLSWQPEEKEVVDNGYMVRGRFAPEGQAFMLSDMTF